MNYTVSQRFLNYVKIDTEADPESQSTPSTEKQKNLTNLLLQELKELGVKVETNDSGYVYGFIPSNLKSNQARNVKKLLFCAHVDTAPDCSGKDVKPIIHNNYQGQDIILPDDPAVVISKTKFPNLNNKIGHDLITASGKTLLGSDDKAGVAIIMDVVNQLQNNPNLEHGEIRILFTTDEEIGRGVDYVDLQKLDADFGYTLDGGDIGKLELDNFSADKLVLEITGVSAHPGYAKNKMENAIKIASEIVSSLPKEALCHEVTEGKEGFLHPVSFQANLENAKIEFILREFDTAKLEDLKELINSVCKKIFINYPNSKYSINTFQQYRNMADVIKKQPEVSEYAKKAIENLGLELKIGSIRGGTDGATLSHLGIPCPNLFSGQQAIHSKYEWISIQDMQKAVDVVLEICRLVGKG